VTALNSNNTVARSNSFVHAEVDGEVVVLNLDAGTSYGLNKVGTRVWTLIAEPKRIGDICATLTTEYAVDEATCVQQVLELLEELRAEGMIDVHDIVDATGS
jgi:hypothetical protein